MSTKTEWIITRCSIAHKNTTMSETTWSKHAPFADFQMQYSADLVSPCLGGFVRSNPWRIFGISTWLAMDLGLDRKYQESFAQLLTKYHKTIPIPLGLSWIRLNFAPQIFHWRWKLGPGTLRFESRHSDVHAAPYSVLARPSIRACHNLTLNSICGSDNPPRRFLQKLRSFLYLQALYKNLDTYMQECRYTLTLVRSYHCNLDIFVYLSNVSARIVTPTLPR
jgi:hypothetical protein